jgi:hypothetical protein
MGELLFSPDHEEVINAKRILPEMIALPVRSGISEALCP